MYRRWSVSVSHSRHRMATRNGMTLIEVLIALVMTLIVLGAMITAFQYASAEISKGRARIEMSNQLRVVLDLLRADLDGLTVDVRPWARTSAPPGYFLYIEGLLRDGWRFNHPDEIMGDVDDILGLTTRSEGKPFRGRFNGAMEESNVAEVIWWTNFIDANGNGVLDYNEPVRLYRRVLLIRPDFPSVAVANQADVLRFFMNNDVSMRWDVANGLLVPNALGDLGRRENRFAHVPLVVNGTLSPNYPHLLDRSFLQSVQMTEANFIALGMSPADMQYIGQDVMLSNVLAFDLKAFSSNAPIVNNNGIVVQPGDPGYVWPVVPPAVTVDEGAFVDLNFLGGAVAYDLNLPQFGTLPVNKWLLYLPAGFTDVEYDTFTTAYEADGLDQDNNGVIDQATNGLDDDGANGVDDEGERETAAPYPFRMSGLQITIRVVEPTSRQITESAAVHNFLPK